MAATKLSSHVNSINQQILSTSRNIQDDVEEQAIEGREDLDTNIVPSVSTPSLPKLSFVSLVVIIVSLGAAAFLSALDATVVAVLTPTLADEFRSVDSVAWYGSIYLLMSGTMQPLFGKLYNDFSPKWLFLTCTSVLEIGSLVCALAQNSPTFIVGRAIAGIGAGGILSGALIIVALIVPLHHRATFTGMIGALECIALIIAPIIGGAMADTIGWRWCFWINLPIGAVLCTVLFFLFHPPRTPQSASGMQRSYAETLSKLDFIGAGVVISSLICLSLALQWGGTQYKWSDSRIVALLVAFGVLFLSAGGHQYWKGEEALFPIRLLKQRGFVLALFNSLCFGGVQYAALYYLPTWFQAVKGDTRINAGVQMLPMVAAIIGVNIVAGAAISFTGRLAPFVVIATVLASIGSGLLYTFTPTISQARIIGYQLVYGAGSGAGVQQAFIGAQAALDPTDVTYASAGVLLVNSMSGVITLCVCQNLFLNRIVALTEVLPGVTTQTLQSGFTFLRTILTPEELRTAIQTYNGAIQDAFLVATILSCASVLGWPFLSWASVKAKKAK
uniref:HC-toxin major facilitator superfamily transporter n=1 Tax=Alternaria jesenskae TaxID=378183 RepID=S5FS33_9PLEO|nr:HC-toxin major facilitator superfamily transporter [Alternaria jesenskae]